MLWHHNARVNSHQRWKQTRFRVCFHLWCELTSTINVTEWQLSWNSCYWHRPNIIYSQRTSSDIKRAKCLTFLQWRGSYLHAVTWFGITLGIHKRNCKISYILEVRQLTSPNFVALPSSFNATKSSSKQWNGPNSIEGHFYIALHNMTWFEMHGVQMTGQI